MCEPIEDYTPEEYPQCFPEAVPTPIPTPIPTPEPTPDVTPEPTPTPEEATPTPTPEAEPTPEEVTPEPDPYEECPVVFEDGSAWDAECENLGCVYPEMGCTPETESFISAPEPIGPPTELAYTGDLTGVLALSALSLVAIGKVLTRKARRMETR